MRTRQSSVPGGAVRDNGEQGVRRSLSLPHYEVSIGESTGLRKESVPFLLSSTKVHDGILGNNSDAAKK